MRSTSLRYLDLATHLALAVGLSTCICIICNCNSIYNAGRADRRRPILASSPSPFYRRRYTDTAARCIISSSTDAGTDTDTIRDIDTAVRLRLHLHLPPAPASSMT